MAPQVLQRISVRWLPDAAYEDSDTVAINVGEYFIDMRVAKNEPHVLQWGRSGKRIRLREDPPTFRWTHIIDSLDLTVPDEAHFERLPNGDDLEIGVTPAPHRKGEPTAYEEVWRDITVSLTTANKALGFSWILSSLDASVFIGKVGDVFLAIHKAPHDQGGVFSAYREQYDLVRGTWVQKYICSGSTALDCIVSSRPPTAVESVLAITNAGTVVAGQKVIIGLESFIVCAIE